MIRYLAPLAMAAALAGAGPKPPVSRTALTDVEHGWDRAVRTFDQTDPYDLLGMTRSLYLPGYGVVLSSELSLVMTPPPSPFAPAPTGAYVEKIHKRKLLRLESLKSSMRRMLVEAASQLASLPEEDRIALGVTLYYRSWENRDGLPAQVVVQAPRRTLLAVAGGAPVTTIPVEEY